MKRYVKEVRNDVKRAIDNARFSYACPSNRHYYDAFDWDVLILMWQEKVNKDIDSCYKRYEAGHITDIDAIKYLIKQHDRFMDRIALEQKERPLRTENPTSENWLINTI